MANADKSPRYRIYLLTMWAEQARHSTTPLLWRFSLEDPRTGQRYGLADLAALIATLEQLMRQYETETDPD